MTKFEQFLIDKGYLKFAFNAKKMKYYKPNSHIISSMVNLWHVYIHNSDIDLLNKIEQGESVMKDDFTLEIRKKEIVFGLNEKDKPVTLISPRPNIKVKRFKNINEQKIEVIEYEYCDDSMNIVLSKISCEQIFKAMYDKSICFDFDFTIN
jgi:hypothetical protein